MRLLVASPHRDDACFSVAMTLLQCSRSGLRIRLVNCFTRSRYAPFSDADQTHANDRMEYVSALRKREDELFVRRLGATEMTDLNLKDAPIRLRCGDDEVCSRDVAPEDKAMLKIRSGIERIVASWKPDALLLPLALGGHVDHLTTRDALLPLVSSLACAFYEDLPYAGRPGVAETITKVVQDMSERSGEALYPVLLGDAGDEERKRSLALLYASQIEDKEASEIASFAAHYGAHERVWANAAWTNAFAQFAFQVQSERATTKG